MTPAASQFDERRFAREATLLALFGGTAVLAVEPALTTTWVGAGALVGAIYWTVMYHDSLAGVRTVLPGDDRLNVVWSFVLVTVVLEFVDWSATVRGGLILGFVLGLASSGLVAAVRTRLVGRVVRETE